MTAEQIHLACKMTAPGVEFCVDVNEIVPRIVRVHSVFPDGAKGTAIITRTGTHEIEGIREDVTALHAEIAELVSCWIDGGLR